MITEAPLLFIHYGNSEYLKYTLKVAKFYNPDKTIILLGDKANSHVTKWGIEHYLIDDFNHSEEISHFHKVFKIVAREGYKILKPDASNSVADGGYFWTKFVFLKMFVMYNFCLANGITRFWTFDSDNLVVTKLSALESAFAGYDNTELNNGNSMHGIINNLNSLKNYTTTINELFVDEQFLAYVSGCLQSAPLHHAYTEMWAYNEYKERNPIKSYYLTEVFENSIFDNKIVWSDGMETQMVSKDYLNEIKRVFYMVDESGKAKFYFKSSKTGEYIRAYSFDCSWIPMLVYERIYKAITNGTHKFGEYQELDFKENVNEYIKRLFWIYKTKLTQKIKQLK